MGTSLIFALFLCNSHYCSCFCFGNLFMYLTDDMQGDHGIVPPKACHGIIVGCGSWHQLQLILYAFHIFTCLLHTSACPSALMFVCRQGPWRGHGVLNGKIGSPFISYGKVNSCSSGPVQAYGYIKLTYITGAHGAMMIFAWMFISPLASMAARYLKGPLPGAKWFNIHRFGQVCSRRLAYHAV